MLKRTKDVNEEKFTQFREGYPVDVYEFIHRLMVRGKGKMNPCTGTEALYRPYGP